MTITPQQSGEESAHDDDAPASIPVRRYRAGECFGASGLIPGDSYRRDTATAVGHVTLKEIPHNHFRVMLRDDKFLKAGLRANDVYHSKLKQADAHGLHAVASGRLIPSEIFDELEDEIVLKAMRK
jgi:hypothetical protein